MPAAVMINLHYPEENQFNLPLLLLNLEPHIRSSVDIRSPGSSILYQWASDTVMIEGWLFNVEKEFAEKVPFSSKYSLEEFQASNVALIDFNVLSHDWWASISSPLSRVHDTCKSNLFSASLSMRDSNFHKTPIQYMLMWLDHD